MLRQYQEIKKNHADAILFFRLGDFYEMFGPDALEASKILNITLTARSKGTDNEIPMCGIPYHAAEGYIAKLTKQGKKVAICEQLSDPALPGIVKRDVIRIVTPGTTLDNNILENKQNNYLVSIFRQGNIWGLSLVDLTTGEFKLTEISNKEILKNEIFRINPAEIILTPGLLKSGEVADFIKDFNYNTFLPPTFTTPENLLIDHFHVRSLEGFGIANYKVGIEAAANLLAYLKETQKTTLEHINHLALYNFSEYMVLDEATLRNLEILKTIQEGNFENSLLSIIDKTQTAMAGRLLRQWLLHPLLCAEKINQRLEAVAEFTANSEWRNGISLQLKEISDIERLLGRIGCQRANARDLIALKNSLEIIPYIKKILKLVQSDLLKELIEALDNHQEVIDIINQTIKDDPAISLQDGDIIRAGYNQELDELRQIVSGGKDWIKNLQAQEIKRTGISSLKVRFNKIFGYYIEVSNANLSSVPANYTRKQTLVNGERFITPELKEYEEKVLGAEDKIKNLEYKLFLEIREKISRHILAMQKTALALAQIDVLLSFANLALLNNYCRPQIREDNQIIIKNGRHPVIEIILNNQYIPNDVVLNSEDHLIILLTGPNMSGKSSFLRQVALIVLLAQIGSFVSAEEASIGIVDRIFTRVGATDNLAAGCSTFMMEMQEAANIINNATSKSLIILDELGRGTSTYDGVSIAWAVLEYLHNKIKAKTLFATHYHELIQAAEGLPNAQNYSVAVKENENEGVVFLRKVVKGGIDKSYGVEVAKLAGLPKDLIFRAMTILSQLENENNNFRKMNQPTLPLMPKTNEHPVILQLKQLDLDNLTPLEALKKLEELKTNFTTNN